MCESVTSQFAGHVFKNPRLEAFLPLAALSWTSTSGGSGEYAGLDQAIVPWDHNGPPPGFLQQGLCTLVP